MFPKKYSSRSGFTLLELIAVITILALLLGVIAPGVIKYMQRAKVRATRVQLSSIEQALNAFNLDCGYFPSTEQTLDALVTAPSIGKTCKNYDPNGYWGKKTIPKDPFQKDFIYVSPGQHGAYDLSSAGPDGIPDNEDDIRSWDE